VRNVGLGSLSMFISLFSFVLIVAIIQNILINKGKEKWAKAIHYLLLCLGLVLLSKVFLELIYVAEEMLAR
jgi:hypothetical protein